MKQTPTKTKPIATKKKTNVIKMEPFQQRAAQKKAEASKIKPRNASAK